MSATSSPGPPCRPSYYAMPEGSAISRLRTASTAARGECECSLQCLSIARYGNLVSFFRQVVTPYRSAAAIQ